MLFTAVLLVNICKKMLSNMNHHQVILCSDLDRDNKGQLWSYNT